MGLFLLVWTDDVATQVHNLCQHHIVCPESPWKLLHSIHHPDQSGPICTKACGLFAGKAFLTEAILVFVEIWNFQKLCEQVHFWFQKSLKLCSFLSVFFYPLPREAEEKQGFCPPSSLTKISVLILKPVWM